MVIYFCLVLIVTFLSLIHGNVNLTIKRKKRFLFQAFGIMILLAILRGPTIGSDLAGHYARNFSNIAFLSWSRLLDFSVLSGYEIGYVVFCKLISLISTDVQWFITVVGVITYSVMARFIYRNSENVVLSTFLVIFSCTYYMFFNILRQALAVSIVLLGYEVLKSKKNKIRRYIIFALMVVLAMSFHQSAIICFAFILFDILRFERRHIVIATAAVAGFYFLYDKVYSFVLLFVGNRERYAAHIDTIEGSGGIDKIAIINITLTFGAFLLGYFSLVWNKKRNIRNFNGIDARIELEHEHSVWLYLCLMAGTFRLLTTQMNILNRATYYFLPFVFVMYPAAINRSGKFRKIFMYFTYLGYFAYFFIMTTKLAGAYYGVVPYKFFWQ